MALIVKQGLVPATPHTEFYSSPGVLALEEIHGSYGFSGPYARKYHMRSYPTEAVKQPRAGDFNLTAKAAKDATLQPFHLLTKKMPVGGDPLRARRPLVFGANTIVSVSRPDKSMEEAEFFRNGEKHELYYVQEGTGSFKTEYGDLPIRKGLYLVVPKGTTYRIDLFSKDAWFLVVESGWPIRFPPHYQNSEGQASMMAPVVETEIEIPQLREAVDRKGEYAVDIKHGGGRITRATLGHHPFDLIGWEGALYPFGFDIKNHHGIAREIHTAPPMHQTFESGSLPHGGFSVCSFVPQMEGWHPKDVPAPYAHFNVDSDEVMFFSNAKYGARKGVIEDGSFTFHPGSVPHSPQGQAALRSFAARGKVNDRLAVMLDTMFEPLTVTEFGYKYRDKDYPLSWHKTDENTELIHGT